MDDVILLKEKLAGEVERLLQLPILIGFLPPERSLTVSRETVDLWHDIDIESCIESSPDGRSLLDTGRWSTIALKFLSNLGITGNGLSCAFLLLMHVTVEKALGPYVAERNARQKSSLTAQISTLRLFNAQFEAVSLGKPTNVFGKLNAFAGRTSQEIIDHLVYTFGNPQVLPYIRMFVEQLPGSFLHGALLTAFSSKKSLADPWQSFAKICHQQLPKAQGQKGHKVLRNYQSEALYNMLQEPRNFVLVAPTGSGKTIVFVEHAKHLLQWKPYAKVVVIVPTVTLTRQHRDVFIAEGFATRGHSVGAFSSDKKLIPSNWRTHLQQYSVVICTAQSLLNCLSSPDQVASLAEIDLLVLDECHHCNRDHPYNGIMEHYKQLNASMKRPQVIGVTASPASAATFDATEGEIRELLENMYQAKLLVVHDDDEEVAQVAPPPQEHEITVSLREMDVQVAQLVREWVVKYTRELEDYRQALEFHGVRAEDPSLYVNRKTLVGNALGAFEKNLQKLTWDSPSQWIHDWLQHMKALFEDWDMRALVRCSQLTCHLHKCLDLIMEVGYEAGVQYLGKSLYDACEADTNEVADRLPIPDMQPVYATTHEDWKMNLLSKLNVKRVPLLRPHQLPCPPVPQNDTNAASCTSSAGGVRERRTVPPPAGRVGWAPGSVDTTASEDGLGSACQVVSILKGPGDRPHDVDLPPGLLLASIPHPCVGNMVRDILNTIIGDVNFLQQAFDRGDDQFPKFKAVLEYLEGRVDAQEVFHGIIFVATRRAVYYLAAMLRRALKSCEVLEFTGKGKRKEASQMALPLYHAVRESASRGMTGRKQQDVIKVFKEPGRKILVSTSASEEGLDVPSCNFVIRYNAAMTGKQRLQSAGRARMKGSDFLCFVLETPKEKKMHQKSRTEQRQMKSFLRGMRDGFVDGGVEEET